MYHSSNLGGNTPEYTSSNGWDDDPPKIVSVYYVDPADTDNFNALFDGNATKQ